MEKFEHSYIDYFNKQVPRLEKRYLEQEQKMAEIQREMDKLYQKFAVLGGETDGKMRETLDTIKAYIDSHLGDQLSNAE